MNRMLNDREYNNIINSIKDNNKFLKIENCGHHGTNRLEHSFKVSYYSYKITKLLKLDFKETARAGLLHDFFLAENNNGKDKIISVFTHSNLALENALENFFLSDKEKDIISSHMFPVLPTHIPKYSESWIVSIIDKVVAIKEFTNEYSKLFKLRYGNALIIMTLLFGKFL